MTLHNDPPATKDELEKAEKVALADWKTRWNRDQQLRDQYGGRFENYLGNCRAKLRATMLKRGLHNR